MNYELLHYMAAKEADPDPDDREQIKKRFQTHFVKEIFLNNVFKSNHLFYGEDNNNDYGLVNQLMINQFADQLVDSNFIDLSHIMIDEIRNKSSKLKLNEVNIETPNENWHDSNLTNEEKKLLSEYCVYYRCGCINHFFKKKLPPSIDYNDLHSVGFDGLLKPIRGFEKSKNVQFKTYANIRVRGEMLDLIRKEWRSKANHKHEAFDDKNSKSVCLK